MGNNSYHELVILQEILALSVFSSFFLDFKGSDSCLILPSKLWCNSLKRKGNWPMLLRFFFNETETYFTVKKTYNKKSLAKKKIKNKKRFSAGPFGRQKWLVSWYISWRGEHIYSSSLQILHGPLKKVSKLKTAPTLLQNGDCLKNCLL